MKKTVITVLLLLFASPVLAGKVTIQVTEPVPTSQTYNISDTMLASWIVLYRESFCPRVHDPAFPGDPNKTVSLLTDAQVMKCAMDHMIDVTNARATAFAKEKARNGQ